MRTVGIALPLVSALSVPALRAEAPKTMGLVRRASDEGLVLSAWCRGVRVLAAADVIRGKRVVGHIDDKDAIEEAGGIYVGHDHPPVIDGRLVTGARSYYYRAKNAEAIRTAMVDRLAFMAESLQPLPPIRSNAARSWIACI